MPGNVSLHAYASQLPYNPNTVSNSFDRRLLAHVSSQGGDSVIRTSIGDCSQLLIYLTRDAEQTMRPIFISMGIVPPGQAKLFDDSQEYEQFVTGLCLEMTQYLPEMKKHGMIPLFLMNMETKVKTSFSAWFLQDKNNFIISIALPNER